MTPRRIRSGRAAAAPLTNCEQLALLLAQRTALASGQAVQEVDTPNLGRTVFTKADMGELQREIDRLTSLCNADNGLPAGTGGRKPFSFEAVP